MLNTSPMWIFIFASYGYVLGVALAVPIFSKSMLELKQENNEIGKAKKVTCWLILWIVTILSLGGVMRAVIRYARLNEQDTPINNFVSLAFFVIGLSITIYLFGYFIKVVQRSRLG